MREPLIRLEHVTIEYRQGKRKNVVLSDVDFEIQSGEWVTITGPSGIGKSSLLHVIAGLIPPAAGKIFYEGKELKKAKERTMYRNQHIGVMFQGSQLYPSLTVWENVALPSRISDYWRSRFTNMEKERAIVLLRQVGLEEKRNAMPHQLSLGQRRRVAIARALMNEPKLLLADEPTNDLDPERVDQILHLFQEIHRLGVTIVLVTHQQSTQAYGTRHIKIEQGKLLSPILQ